MKQVAVIGAGNWGTALAIIAARAGHEVRIWSRNAEVVESINQQHINSVYLSGSVLPEAVRATTDSAEALDRAGLVILAAPSHAARALLQVLKPNLLPGMILVSATKGIEIESGKRISEIATEVLGERTCSTFVCLSGPSFAREVVEGHPTAVVAAGNDANSSKAVQVDLSFENFRIYTNDDLVGTELAGAVKNVIAIAAGMVSGLGFGSNTLAALITRGLSEMSRLALAQGAKIETLMGLAGLGDLVLTCTGGLSRNRYVGQELGKGRSIHEIRRGMIEVAEGINTTRAVVGLAHRVGVEMPIAEEVNAVLYKDRHPRDAAIELMTRPLRGESEEQSWAH